MKLKGQRQVTSWQEDEIRALENEGGRVTRTSVGYRIAGDVDGNATNDAVMSYRSDGTATVVGLWHLIGSAAGRTGSVTFESTGDYDETTATARVRPVLGSAPGTRAVSRISVQAGRHAGRSCACRLHQERHLRLPGRCRRGDILGHGLGLERR